MIAGFELLFNATCWVGFLFVGIAVVFLLFVLRVYRFGVCFISFRLINSVVCDFAFCIVVILFLVILLYVIAELFGVC